MPEVKLLSASDYAEWDNLVEKSLQGTIFSTTKWLNLFDLPFQVYSYYKSKELVGGMANFDASAPLTPFQGIIVKNSPDMKYSTRLSLSNEVATALIPYTPKEFYNHWSFQDIRPFQWAGWKCDIHYTYLVDLTNIAVLWGNLEKQTRYEITKAQRDITIMRAEDIGYFNKLYTETFKRKGLEQPVSSEFLLKFYSTFYPAIFIATKAPFWEPIAGVVIMNDSKRAYYILGASVEGHASSLCLWEAMKFIVKQGITEIDLVGGNNKDIALFKRGFAGKLLPYFGVKKEGVKNEKIV